MSVEEQFNAEIEPFYIGLRGRASTGTPPVFIRDDPAGAVADITTADATDLASAITLVNAIKAKVNALLASLRASGDLAP